MKMLKKQTTLNALLLDACCERAPNFKRILALYNAGADPYAKDETGKTVLWRLQRNMSLDFNHFSCYFNLGGTGQDCYVKSYRSDNITLRFLSAFTGSQFGDYDVPEGFKLLMDNSPDFKARCSRTGGGPLHLINFRKSVLAKHLIAVGCDVNLRDDSDESPLFKAVRQGAWRSIEVLIDAGADVNICNLEGVTPLMVGVKYEKLAAVRRLLKAGAKVNVRDNKGCSAIGLSIDIGNPKIMDAIGVDANSPEVRRSEINCQALYETLCSRLKQGYHFFHSNSEYWEECGLFDDKWLFITGNNLEPPSAAAKRMIGGAAATAKIVIGKAKSRCPNPHSQEAILQEAIGLLHRPSER